ncbi:MAG: hypothetical protein HXY30_03440 [Pseudorhodoplanes sp.]|nr:hypothetical protein [Pseudorhodoplanes sp.]
MRVASIIVLALSVAACATGDGALTTAAAPPSDKPDTGQWKFERRVDPITREPAAVAYLEVSKFDTRAFRTEAGQLQLMCFRNKPVVRLRFTLKVGSDKTAALAYRFDEKPGRDIKARFFARQKAIVVEDDAEVANFAADLATSETLYLRVSSLTASSFSAKFPVHGGSHAIAQAYADCPLPDGKARKGAGV